MAARLHFVVEGQTEETFVNQTLVPHLAHMSIVSDARCVATNRGGMYLVRIRIYGIIGFSEFFQSASSAGKRLAEFPVIAKSASWAK